MRLEAAPRGGSGSYFAPSAGGRSGRKVHGGMGAALLSENRVRRGGQMKVVRRGGKRMWLFRGGRSRKVRGGSRRMHLVVFGGGSGRKLHGRSRKLQGGRQINAFGF